MGQEVKAYDDRLVRVDLPGRPSFSAILGGWFTQVVYFTSEGHEEWVGQMTWLLSEYVWRLYGAVTIVGPSPIALNYEDRPIPTSTIVMPRPRLKWRVSPEYRYVIPDWVAPEKAADYGFAENAIYSRESYPAWVAGKTAAEVIAIKEHTQRSGAMEAPIPTYAKAGIPAAKFVEPQKLATSQDADFITREISKATGIIEIDL